MGLSGIAPIRSRSARRACWRSSSPTRRNTLSSYPVGEEKHLRRVRMPPPKFLGRRLVDEYHGIDTPCCNPLDPVERAWHSAPPVLEAARGYLCERVVYQLDLGSRRGEEREHCARTVKLEHSTTCFDSRALQGRRRDEAKGQRQAVPLLHVADAQERKHAHPGLTEEDRSPAARGQIAAVAGRHADQVDAQLRWCEPHETVDEGVNSSHARTQRVDRCNDHGNRAVFGHDSVRIVGSPLVHRAVRIAASM